jgi:hypothetical protein
VSRTCAIFAGYFVRCPLGGYGWQMVHYLRGFRDLGLDVYFYEDTRHHWQAYDPLTRTNGAAYENGVELARNLFAAAGFGDRWVFYDAAADRYSGLERDAVRALFADAKILINAAGVNHFSADERRGKTNVYIDMDPAYTQLRLAAGDPLLEEIVREHQVHFTFGENIGTARCSIPTGTITWHPTRQPIALDLWPVEPISRDAPFTTIGTWDSAGRDVVLNGERYSWRKRTEWAKVMELPRATGAPFVLAMEVNDREDRARLEGAGWSIRDPIEISRDACSYQRFLVGSRGEFTTAKDVNVRLQSGWFSDRSASYLAAGRPVITQDTGFADLIPTGEGLFSFASLEDAAAAVMAIAADPERQSAAARRIAEQHFAAPKVIGAMLERL